MAKLILKQFVDGGEAETEVYEFEYHRGSPEGVKRLRSLIMGYALGQWDEQELVLTHEEVEGWRGNARSTLETMAERASEEINLDLSIDSLQEDKYSRGTKTERRKLRILDVKVESQKPEDN